MGGRDRRRRFQQHRRHAEIATALGARVVQVPFNGFGDLRNRAIEACRYEWIFSLDSDERCTEAVRDEILALLAGSPPHDVYLVPRRNYMMGRWIRGSGWYPNFRQPQLFRKGAMRYTLEPVHEGYENLSDKPLGTLQNAIWQFPFRNLEEVIRKMNRYSSLGAPKLAHKRVSMGSAFGHGLWSFLKHYVFKRGFIDGWAGFVIALRQFRGHLLSLRQALRGDAGLAAAGRASRSNGRTSRTVFTLPLDGEGATARRHTRAGESRWGDCMATNPPPRTASAIARRSTPREGQKGATASPPVFFDRPRVGRLSTCPPALEKVPRARGTPRVRGALKFTQCAQTKMLGPAGLDASRHRGLSKSDKPQVRQTQGVPRAVFEGLLRLAPGGRSRLGRPASPLELEGRLSTAVGPNGAQHF